jgi:hypothetical protein
MLAMWVLDRWLSKWMIGSGRARTALEAAGRDREFVDEWVFVTTSRPPPSGQCTWFANIDGVTRAMEAL